MLLEAIGATLSAALAIALSPFPVIGVVVMLGSSRGRRNGLLFAGGWVAGLSVLAVLVVVVFGGADDPDSTSSAVADWLRVIGGAGLIVLGVRKWMKRPRSGEVVAVPGWLGSLDDTTAWKALGLGVLLAGANPKNVILTAAAAGSIVETGAHGRDLVVAVAVFVLVGSCTVVGAVVVRFVGGRWGRSLLDGTRQFMIANGAVITVIVLMLIGANVLGAGLAGLGR